MQKIEVANNFGICITAIRTGWAQLKYVGDRTSWQRFSAPCPDACREPTLGVSDPHGAA
jgi:hypothetical protein